MAAYTVIHFINLLVNHICLVNEITNPSGEIISVNYMFSLVPENPLLSLFYSVIPFEYWYMYMLIPVAAIYLGAIYGVDYLISRAKARKNTSIS
jgi:hypothetical protein